MSKTLSKIARTCMAGILAASCALIAPMPAFAELQAGTVNAQEQEAVEESVQEDAQDSTQQTDTGAKYSWRYENDERTQAESADACDESLFSTQTTVPVVNSSYSIVGIDVSHYQGDIDWVKVKSSNNVRFAIIACGDGVTYDDEKFVTNCKNAQYAGMPIGVYLYSRAMNTTEAKAEANKVIRMLNSAGLSQSALQLPVYLDMEQNNPDKTDQGDLSATQIKAIFDTFRSTMQASGWSRIGLYANCSWLRNQCSKIEVSSDDLWVASWGVSDPYKNFTDLAWRGGGVWQASEQKFAGISGGVDTNYARYDLGYLKNINDEVNMFRLYNKWSGEHLYTASVKECQNLEKLGWKFEGVAWRAPSTSGIPVYRLYNKWSGDHHYTTSKEEYDKCMKAGWTGENIAWYSAWVDQMPLYRLFNKYETVGTHHYTASEQERDHLASIGWKKEGRAWYGLN